MPPVNDAQDEALLRFNREVLDQALALVAAHELAGAPAFARPVGAHLRHIVEHYEALLIPATRGEADYDRRPRDRELESDTAVARARVTALQQRLAPGAGLSLSQAVRVRGLGGLAGDVAFAVGSTIGRELVFVASHAVHHFALLQPHCRQHGIPIGADFGKAPATVAHERRTQPTDITISAHRKEIPCPVSLQAA